MAGQKAESVRSETGRMICIPKEIRDRSIITMECLHEIVNGGSLTELRTDGVVDGAEIGAECPSGSYTCWIMQDQSGYRCSLYTRNQEAAL